MTNKGAGLMRKLLFRLDGTADSAKTEFSSAAGQRWLAEFCLHSGTDAQAPALTVFFRCRSNPLEPQRYTRAPAGVSKIPREAVKQVGENQLQELLATSVKL